ncbi:MAG: PleD family two-component system response regulator [Candidatus Hydrothermarchaeales archaeon]
MSKIMLVDDEPDILLLVGEMLRGEGYDVVEVKSGVECLENIKREKPDLVLLDIMMQDIDGWEVCKKIKEDAETKDIPVAMLTVRTSEESKIKSFNYSSADAHIDKPFDKEELFSIIEGLLKERGKE